MIRPSLELASARAQLEEIEVELTRLELRGVDLSAPFLRTMLGRALTAAA